MRTIIFGPSPSGKTFHAHAFRDFFGCDEIVDGWDPNPRRLRYFSNKPGENALILTNVSPDACQAAFPGAHILSIADAKAALEQSKNGQPMHEIAGPIPFPDCEGYVTLHGDSEGQTQDWFLHTGCRAAFARPQWAGGSILIHILGGFAAEAGFEEEGCALLLSPEGLRKLGHDLIAIAEGRQDD